jgi:hypothetical protein
LAHFPESQTDPDRAITAQTKHPHLQTFSELRLYSFGPSERAGIPGLIVQSFADRRTSALSPALVDGDDNRENDCTEDRDSTHDCANDGAHFTFARLWRG